MRTSLGSCILVVLACTAASDDVSSWTELKSKVEGVQSGQSATFTLSNNFQMQSGAQPIAVPKAAAVSITGDNTQLDAKNVLGTFFTSADFTPQAKLTLQGLTFMNAASDEKNLAALLLEGFESASLEAS